MTALASDQMQGRATPSPELDLAAALIATAFADAGLRPPTTTSSYHQRFRCGDADGSSANVIGVLPGRDASLAQEAVLLSAHYDHLGTDEGPDPVFNGANDNASGVAALIAVARSLGAAHQPPRRSIVFAAFCGEEIGMRGSKHYVAHPAWPLRRTIAHLNLEMLGRPEPLDPPRAWVTGRDRSDLAEHLQRAQAAGVRFVAATDVGLDADDAFARSDNYPLAQAGVVAHTIAAGRLDEHYHSVDDEPDTLDYERMAQLVEAIVQGAAAIADSETPPRWVR